MDIYLILYYHVNICKILYNGLYSAYILISEATPDCQMSFCRHVTLSISHA